MRSRQGLMRFVALGCLGAWMGCAGADDHVGAYDGTLTDTRTVGGETTTEQIRATVYFLEAEEGAALYLPGYDCVLEASFEEGALKVKGQRCEKMSGSSGYDYRFDGGGAVEEGELELDLSYTATITTDGVGVEQGGRIDFKGEIL